MCVASIYSSCYRSAHAWSLRVSIIAARVIIFWLTLENSKDCQRVQSEKDSQQSWWVIAVQSRTANLFGYRECLYLSTITHNNLEKLTSSIRYKQEH